MFVIYSSDKKKKKEKTEKYKHTVKMFKILALYLFI